MFPSTSAVPVPKDTLELPAPDGFLHIYNFPVGQGDAQLVQCPSGQLGLVDFGSNQWPKRNPEDERFWGPQEILVGLFLIEHKLICIYIYPRKQHIKNQSLQYNLAYWRIHLCPHFEKQLKMQVCQ